MDVLVVHLYVMRSQKYFYSERVSTQYLAIIPMLLYPILQQILCHYGVIVKILEKSRGIYRLAAELFHLVVQRIMIDHLLTSSRKKSRSSSSDFGFSILLSSQNSWRYTLLLSTESIKTTSKIYKGILIKLLNIRIFNKTRGYRLPPVRGVGL